MRIVIAEDSVLLRAGLTRLLADAGEEVVAAVDNADDLLTVVERHQPELILKEHRRQPGSGHCPRNRHRDCRAASHSAARGQRGIDHGDNRRVAVLFEFAGDQRTEVGERGLRPVDRRHPIPGLPVAHANEVEPRAFEDAGVVAERELLHPLQNEELDLGNLLQVDERVIVAVPRRVDRRATIARHGTGTELMTSSMTISTLTP